MFLLMDKKQDQDNRQQRNNPSEEGTQAQNNTPLSERISETGMDQLEEKTERVTHINESENQEGTPWSPGQASS
jgi:hypothetical protein